MDGAALDRWVKAAAAAAAPQGEIVFIHAIESLGPLLVAFEARFGAITVLPFSPRPGEPVSRILVRGIKGSRGPLKLLASRPLHDAEGDRFAPEIDAILRGSGPLLW